VYERLLTVFRLLLPTSYLLMYALTPLIPSLLARHGVAIENKPLVYSAFLGARVATFALFGSWAGWHGRWRTPIWTTGAMLAGFALTLLAPSVLWACVGLALFGVGLGGIYTGALYYVMEVGASEVEAGGTHEALIGGGYALGPAIGLAGLWLASDGVAGSRLTSSQATVLLALGAGVLAAGVAAWAALRGNRRAR
jgi:MFS family permease